MPRRRDFIRLAAGVTAVGPLLLHEAIRKAAAIPAASPTGTIKDVEHVVILMQENRSFDHYFGVLRGVRGFGDPRPIPIYGTDASVRPVPVWQQPYSKHADGHILPYPLHPQPVPKAACFTGLPHDWKTGQDAVNRGRFDGWAQAKTPQTMAYYQPADLPFHAALAETFTICDAYHCSIVGPTHPNRMFLWSGSNGQGDKLHGPRVGNWEKRYQFTWTTYPERLQAAGITWQLYQNSRLNNGKDQFGATNAGLNALQWFKNYDHEANAASELVTRGNAVRTLDDLRADVRDGKLPQVSWIIPPGGCCEHPQFPPAYGATFMASLLDALTSDPVVWSKTALFIMYDENDGFFDHMPSPMPPAPGGASGLSTVATTDEIHSDGKPFGLGARVPMLIVSPWSRGGWVNSQVFDHTSVIRFLERRFGVMEPNISAWRRSVCGDLTTAFDFTTPNSTKALLPDTSGYLGGQPPDTKSVKLPAVPVTQAMPAPITGTRPARALPYALAADAWLDPQKRRLLLTFANTGTVGAVFHVFLGHGTADPRAYTVEAGKTLEDTLDLSADGDGKHEVTVYGPNGFLRCFRGDYPAATAARPEVVATTSTDGLAVILSLRNPGAAPCVLTMTANAYAKSAPRVHRLAANAIVEDSWPLAGSHGWYDVSVTSDSSAGFVRRYAGHAEQSAPSTTDPAMGAVIAAAPF